MPDRHPTRQHLLAYRGGPWTGLPVGRERDRAAGGVTLDAACLEDPRDLARPGDLRRDEIVGDRGAAKHKGPRHGDDEGPSIPSEAAPQTADRLRLARSHV